MKRLLDPLVLTCCHHTQRLASTVNANVMTVFGFPVTRKTAAAATRSWGRRFDQAYRHTRGRGHTPSPIAAWRSMRQ